MDRIQLFKLKSHAQRPVLTDEPRRKKRLSISRPDYTVGIGISPIRGTQKRSFADYTAGGELHPAPKNIHLSLLYENKFRLSSAQTRQN